jgi:hypothetical protein
VSLISAVEAATATLAGVALGFPLFFAIRAPLAGIPFTGTPFFPSDLSLTLMDVLIVAIGLPVGAALAAWIALHRVQISPAGRHAAGDSWPTSRVPVDSARSRDPRAGVLHRRRAPHTTGGQTIATLPASG